MKNVIFPAFLAIALLAACTPAITPVPTEIPVPTATFTPVPQTFMPTLEFTPIPVTPLPTQLTIPVTLDPAQAEQLEEIKGVLQAYFDLRYQALSVSPPEDFQVNGFGDLVSNGIEARDFLSTEMAKLAVQTQWYELKGYRYAKYEYSLKYKDIFVDASAQTATISLLEDFTIVTKWDMEHNPEEPSSIIGDLTHEIVLHNEQGQWKIISDIYRDAWWRQYRKPGRSTNEILREINMELQKLEAMPSATPWSSPTP